MGVKHTESTMHSAEPSRLLSLPFEVQAAIYKHCYPPWSLVLRDHLYTIPPYRRFPNASPGLNLILVYRDIYRIANPIL